MRTLFATFEMAVYRYSSGGKSQQRNYRCWAWKVVAMSESLACVVCPTVAELVTDGRASVPVDCELRYTVADGFAVTATFSTLTQSVSWTFARCLLDQGRYRPTGEGDIVVRPALDNEGHAAVGIELSSPDGSAVLRTPAFDVAHFLQMTQALVPEGDEMSGVDVDAAITDLLGHVG
jgi:hypothetical protein